MEQLTPHRKHVRMPLHLYTGGAFFITICTRNREPIISKVRSAKVILTPLGEVVKEEWHRTAGIRHGVQLGDWVIMPDHFHGVVHLEKTPAPKQSLSAMIRGFKGACTARLREWVGNDQASIWQRGYYERIIRNQRELESIEEYVRANPYRWETHAR